MRLMCLFAALLSLTSGLAGAAEIDRPCSDDRSTRSPVDGGLKILGNCAKAYGKAKTKVENTRDNIKFVDDTLACYQQRSEAFAKAVDKYQSSCLVLMRKFCKACSPMDVVNNSVIDVQITGAESDKIDAIVRSQEFFLPFGRVVSNDEGDLACGSQIITSTKRITDAYYSNIQRFAHTKCDE